MPAAGAAAGRDAVAGRGVAVVIVGGGPRGSGLLERLAANAPELLGDVALTVHVVEPFTPGAGRIWRHEQSPWLWANSMAEDMTMFTDASCRIEGPVRPGPTFQEWAHLPAGDAPPSGVPELDAERTTVAGMTFPSRRLVTQYLTWTFRRTLGQLPPNVTVRVHPTRAVDVVDAEDGRQLVRLADGAPLAADVVLLAQGHLPTLALGASGAAADEARRFGLDHLAEEYTADSDLSLLAPARDVIVRGAGLAFVDLAVLVTQGRGGRYAEGADGVLTYHPSGAEPRLFVGSRRGVPYRSKIGYRLQGPPAPHPRFLDPAAVDTLLARPGELDFRADVWPLLVKELAFGHYHELFAAHPERVRVAWPRFETTLAALPWDGADLSAEIAAAVPDPADRFDPDALDRPLRGLRLPDADALQEHLVRHVEADLARRADPRHSADLGVFVALLRVLEPLGRVLASGRLSLASTARDVPWFTGFFSYVASGPPPRRLRELLALVHAGIVRFLGADVEVAARPAEGDRPAAWVATSPTVPGEVTAGVLVEARVPRAAVAGTADELLAALHHRGDVAEQELVDAAGTTRLPTGRVLVTPDTSQVIDASGRVHLGRYAFGSGTSAATAGAFSRPGTDAAFFRQNDHAVRTLLRGLARREREPSPEPEHTAEPVPIPVPARPTRPLQNISGRDS